MVSLIFWSVLAILAALYGMGTALITAVAAAHGANAGLPLMVTVVSFALAFIFAWAASEAERKLSRG